MLFRKKHKYHGEVVDVIPNRGVAVVRLVYECKHLPPFVFNIETPRADFKVHDEVVMEIYKK